MTSPTTVVLPARPDATAPDGSEVRVLAASPRGSMAHFRLKPGQVARAVRHRSVEELWFVLEGRGDLWRADGGRREVTRLQPGVSVVIPAGTVFQFRADAQVPLAVVAVTMPPWPGEDEAIPAEDHWLATG